MNTIESQYRSRWRLLRYFGYYRLIVAAVFLAAITVAKVSQNIGSQNPQMFIWVCTFYAFAAVGILVVQTRWRHAFNLQTSAQVLIDIGCLTLLLFASGGAKSGMSMMLLVVLVGAGLVGQGRLVLFYAAVAAVSLLLEQAYRVLYLHGDAGDFFFTGLTCIGFFGSAIAARLLARRMLANEALAHRRGLELADQTRINERVIRDMQDGVLVIDPQGNICQCNARAQALLGSGDAGNTSLEAYSKTLAEEFQARRALGVESELVIQLPWNGRMLRARFLPPGEGGNALIFIEDVGRMQQEARQVKLAALGRLTANMAHEIRNPLSAISHAAELLAEAPPDNGVGRLTRIIGDNVRRINRLISEVTELGRRDRTRPEIIDLQEFFSRLIEERGLRETEILSRLAVDIPAGTVVCFDRGHLYRVVSNLLDNALRYATDAPGAVRISVEDNPSPRRLSMHVSDDGPGIDPDSRQHLFEPFFTTGTSGTGLGLYIARELCEANGARLFVLNDAPAGGHFCISCAANCQDSTPFPELS